MNELDNKKVSKTIIVILIIILLTIVITSFFVYYIKSIKYDNVIFPNTYLGNYEISKVNYKDLEQLIDSLSDDILNNNEIIFRVNDREYKSTFKELNLVINKDDIISKIKNDQVQVGGFNKFKRVNGISKKTYNYSFKYNLDDITSAVTKLKDEVDVVAVYDHLAMDDNRQLSYVEGINGYNLDVSKSVNAITQVFDSGKYSKVDLVGDIVNANVNSSLASVDTIVSSFTTEFDPNISRADNLRTGLAYIDGAIIYPGEIFSFYNYAGPYNKSGYVWYYEFIGNGVCQIATTVYDAALLGGLEIVKRYPHKAKSVYVPGGLDATVASYSNGWNVDMQFKNTYDYPLYISAYAIGGTAHVDFWSNHDAKKGKTYSTSSVKIAERGYISYLHVYENGVEIEKRQIATTWYLE